MTNTQIVAGLYEAFARGDVAAVLGTFAEDIEWHEADGSPYGGRYVGGEAIVGNVLGPVMNDIPDFAASPERVIADGDSVAVIARYTGTGSATGRRIDLPVVHVWTVANGKVVRFEQFVDTLMFRKVVPRDAPAGA